MQDIFETIEYKELENMASHTTFRVGGAARYFFVPKNVDEIKQIVEYCQGSNTAYMVLGNGSNVLFTDNGYDGIVIQIFHNMEEIRVVGKKIYAEAGALLSKIAATARDNSLTGFEFAAGIPGTIGGAVVMNAGAYGGEMKNVVTRVDVLTKDGTVKSFRNEEMDFAYRHSIIDDSMIVIGVEICLEEGNMEDIQAEMDRLKEARVSKQPLEYPSAGSTFKRPKDMFAGKLIEDAGLRGYRVGGAMVSEKHCGFVINYDKATAGDVLQLIDDVREKVAEKFGVVLEPEVRIIK